MAAGALLHIVEMTMVKKRAIFADTSLNAPTGVMHLVGPLLSRPFQLRETMLNMYQTSCAQANITCSYHRTSAHRSVTVYGLF